MHSKRQDSSLGVTSSDSARTEKKQSFIYEQQVKPKLDLLKKKTAYSKSKQPSQTEFPAKLPHPPSSVQSREVKEVKDMSKETKSKASQQNKIKFKRLQLPEDIGEQNSDEGKNIPEERKIQEPKIPNQVRQF